MAFDKHLNVVLADTEEFRIITPKGKTKDGKKAKVRTEKRVLGFVLLRGENIVSITPETPPPPKAKLSGPGVGMPVGSATPVGRGIAPMTMSTAFPPQGMMMGPPGTGMAMPPPPPGAMGRGMPPCPPGMGRGI